MGHGAVMGDESAEVDRDQIMKGSICTGVLPSC